MAATEELINALRKSEEIVLSVKGRKSGNISSRPVWFILSGDENSIFLIPVNGRKTQWYLNVKKEPNVTMSIGSRTFRAELVEVRSQAFEEVLAGFKKKYGEENMARYYPRLEVALAVPLPTSS